MFLFIILVVKKGITINQILHCDLCAQELELHVRSIKYYKDLLFLDSF
jgi:hypothetical protein